jgi:hypothetical protein
MDMIDNMPGCPLFFTGVGHAWGASRNLLVLNKMHIVDPGTMWR